MNRRIVIGQRLVAAFVLGALLLTNPIFSLFNRQDMLFGIPVLYVYLHSQPGAGATFTFTLPIRHASCVPRQNLALPRYTVYALRSTWSLHV